MSNQDENQKVRGGLAEARKSYKAPELHRWGSMRDITLSAGSVSPNSDGAMKSPNRTS